MTRKKLDYILFDMIGTTVNDSSMGDSLIIDCIQKAFVNNGLQVAYIDINQQRGKTKKEAIKNIITNSGKNVDLVNKIYAEFISMLDKSLINLPEIKDATNLFRLLQKHDVKIGLGSGLPMHLITKIIDNIGWKNIQFDYIGSSEDLGKGRPDPIMVYDSLSKLNIQDKSRVLKVGDTIADIQEGKNAGVLTAAVLTGTSNKDVIRKYKPDYIFNDITEIVSII